MPDTVYEHVQALLEDDTEEKAKRTIVLIANPIPDEGNPVIEVEGEVTSLQPGKPRWHMHVPLWAWIVGCGVSVFIAATLVLTMLVPLFTISATITLYPQAQTASFTAILTLTQARPLAPLTISQELTVPATGHGHQDAAEAHGTFTFYNALESVQVIQAGTMLTSNNGVQAVTDQAAVIPAGTFTQNGYVTVPAHTLSSGAAVNLPAGSIQGACCRAYVLVTSSAFTGGRDERDYTAVEQRDIDQAAARLRGSIGQSMSSAIRAHTDAGEAVTPPACSETIVPDHSAGQEAASVTVMVTRTCQATAYHTGELAAQANTATLHHAPASYVPSGNQVTITRVTADNGIVRVTATLTATFVYHFSQSEIEAFARQIAGKSKTDASIWLLRHAGIRQVMLLIQPDRDRLPQDPTHIHMVVPEGQ